MAASLPKEYEDFRPVGSGTYGDVLSARSRVTNELVAIKRIKMDPGTRGVPATTLREVAILKALNRRQGQPGADRIVKLHEVIYDLNNIFLIFELCDTDLDACVRKQALTPHQVKRFMRQILEGLDFIHDNEILHRDIKPNNVMCRIPPGGTLDDAELRIIDFGLARSIGITVASISSNVVSLWYRCPELVMGSQTYTMAVDIWSAGCIFYYLLVRKALFAVRDDGELFSRALSYFYDGPESVAELRKLPNWAQWEQSNKIPAHVEVETPGLDPLGRDLFLKMMRLNPGSRISAKEALKHPWFADLRQGD